MSLLVVHVQVHVKPEHLVAFESATATRIVFGAGTLSEVGPLARELGRRAIVVTGRDGSRAAPLLDHLQSAGIETTLFAIVNEPTVDDITRGAAHARGARVEFV